ISRLEKLLSPRRYSPLPIGETLLSMRGTISLHGGKPSPSRRTRRILRQQRAVAVACRSAAAVFTSGDAAGVAAGQPRRTLMVLNACRGVQDRLWIEEHRP